MTECFHISAEWVVIIVISAIFAYFFRLFVRSEILLWHKLARKWRQIGCKAHQIQAPSYRDIWLFHNEIRLRSLVYQLVLSCSQIIIWPKCVSVRTLLRACPFSVYGFLFLILFINSTIVRHLDSHNQAWIYTICLLFCGCCWNERIRSHCHPNKWYKQFGYLHFGICSKSIPIDRIQLIPMLHTHLTTERISLSLYLLTTLAD